MSSDLVTRLRSINPSALFSAIAREAADEIERLRAELDALGVAIADAGYTWTPEMRAAYEKGKK